MELYIINESGVVEYSTYAPDLGLDFKTSVPYFYEYLTRIRNSSGFYPDRVVQELSTGQLRKFAYSPTYDHNYVLELGLADDSIEAERKSLQYRSTISSMAENNPYANKIRLFTMKKRLVGNRSFVPNPYLDGILNQIIEERESREFINRQSGITTQYLFIDLMDDDYASDMSLIVELEYDNALIRQAIDEIIYFQLLVAIVVLFLASLLAIFAAKKLTKPIEQISDDVDKISRGDLDHEISPTMGREFAVLENSINAMLVTLKGTIKKLQEGEEELQLSEKLYRGVVESQTEFITRFLPDGTITFANDAYCDYLGRTSAEMIGSHFKPSIPQEDKEKVALSTRRLTPENHVSSIEHRIIMSDGQIRWQQWNNMAIFNAEGKVIEYQSVGRDITKRKIAEEEVKKLTDELEERVNERTGQLEEANRELESFSYSVSHYLRSPLRAIDGFSTILLEEYYSGLTPDARRYLEKIKENTRQMSRLIEDLLNFSRTGRQPLTKTTVDPVQIARKAYGSLRPEYEGRFVDLEIGYMPECSADPSLLTLIFSNLFSNSLKFTRNNEFARIEVGSFYEPSGVVYFIKDNGIGFDMKYAHKLFGVFQRLHDNDSYEGTGVGLAIVQRIIHRHGGKIWVHSEIDQGTTFFFTLDGSTDVDS